MASTVAAHAAARTSTQRQAVIEALIANDGNVKRTVRETGVPETTVRRWRDEEGIPPLTISEDPWEIRDRRHASFWGRVDIESSKTGCWLWTGGLDLKGYGTVFGKGAHRFAFEERHGPLNGRHLHHVCANRRCVNPAHLLPVADAAAHARVEKLERQLIACMRAEAFTSLESPGAAA
jgi:hypothetical protein